MNRLFFFIVLFFWGICANASVQINGIYYNLDDNAKVAEVIRNPNLYSGDISIPAQVSYGGYSYSVTSIGDYAFSSCSGITSLTIPNSVIYIGEGAFEFCSGLTSLTIPNSVISIGGLAFFGCNSITSVTIPSSVTSISGTIFGRCSNLNSINVEVGNPKYDSRDNCNAVIRTSDNTLIDGCNNTTIPISIKKIGAGAFFGCSGLTSVTIPNSVTSIGGDAFYGCNSITSVTIPSSVTSIDNNAFRGCSNLNSINVEVGNPKYDSRDNCNAIIRTADNTLYTGCKNTIIPGSVTSIGYSAFAGCSGLTLLTIPNSVKSIGDYAFEDCSGLTALTIPNSVTSIGNSVIYGCSNISSINVENGNTVFDSRNNCNAIIRTADNTLITGCKNTNIPNNVTSIGNYAFYYCSGLTSVTIPQSVTSIGSFAFWGCNSITSVTVEATTPIAINEDCFPMGANATLYVPAGCKAAYQAAAYWKVFVNIVEASPIINFADPTVKALCVQNWDTNGDGELSEAEAAAVSSLGRVFKENKAITSFDELKYFTGLTSINSHAFYGCSGLTSLTIPGSVTSIGDDAFWGCSGLTSLIIPNGVISIGEYAFYYCSGLISLTIPNSVTNIGGAAFSGCNGLTSMIIPNNVTSIGGHVFDGCSRLTSVTIPNSVTSICEYAFWGCSGLTSVTIPNNVTYIGGAAFGGCSGLTSLKIPNSVISIGDWAFSGCKGLISLIIPNSVNSIGDYAFWGCGGLTSVTLPNSVTSIGNSAFYGCDRLISVTVESTTPIAINEDCFTNRTNATLYVPAGCKAAYQAADYWKEFKEIVEIEPDLFTLSITSVGNGYVSYSGYTINETAKSYAVSEGSSATLTFTPNDGYRVKSVLVNGTDVISGVTNSQYTISNINQDVSVVVTFEAIPTTLTLSVTSLSLTSSETGNKTITVTVSPTNATVTAASSDTNICTVSVSGTGATRTITITPKENTGISQRTATITVTATANGQSATKTISVTQAGVPGSAPIISAFNVYDVTRTSFYFSMTFTSNPAATTYGVCYSTTNNVPNSTTYWCSLSFPSTGRTASSYVTDNLTPGTTYYVRAYATNSYGTTYSTDIKTVTIPPALTGMTVDGVNYKVNSYNGKTVNVATGDYGKVLNVPAAFGYEGDTWTVTGIESGALTNATDLAAVIWNPLMAFTERVNNPNLLLYVTSASYAPSSAKNVIVNNVAQTITLTETSSGNDFYCPRSFTARTISYSHRYQMTTGIDDCQGWETIALPFDVQTISHESKGGVAPFAVRTSSQKGFWLYELTSSGWKVASAIKANTPYIISMPNNELYFDAARLNGRITFSAANVSVPMTRENTVSYRGRTFVPSFMHQARSGGIYALNVKNEWYTTSGTEGSLFVANLRDVSPFEAYMTTTNNSRGWFGIFDDTPTDIRGVEELIDTKRLGIYNLNGQKVKNAEFESVDELKQALPAGVYIINGHKVIVR